MSRIDWRHDGRRIVVKVALLPPFAGLNVDHHIGRALVDTGATTSGITPRMVKALDLRGQGKRPLNSAHGPKQTERYLFRVGLFPDLAEENAPPLPFIFDDVLGFALEDSFEFEALIGMDILSQCDFSADRRGRCSLRFGYD
jgi:hypothetical protein